MVILWSSCVCLAQLSLAWGLLALTDVVVLACSTRVLMNIAQAFHLIQLGNVPGSPSGGPQCFLEVASKRSCPLLGPLLAVGLSLFPVRC